MPHANMRPREIGSLSEFVDWAGEIQDNWTIDGGLETPWFRGVGDRSFHLVPGLYRENLANALDSERKCRNEYRRQGIHLVSGIAPDSVWDWYFLMQHYRLPTRLLDWTDGALIALRFALDAAANNTRPTVWALNPFRLNEVSVGQLKILRSEDLLGSDDPRIRSYLPDVPRAIEFVPQLPVAIAPSYIDRRLFAQRSCFTVHGTLSEGLDEMENMNVLQEAGHLRKASLSLGGGGRDQMKLLLSTCGISETTLFPDFEGLARQVAREYLF